MLTQEANRLAARDILDGWLKNLPDRERLDELDRMDRGIAIAEGARGDLALARLWCSDLQDVTRANL
ncbi:hypothetical protein [Algihabitans albus]|uniref:hypothetical protein n=1 Tax=Algihabitans albus TaxID=2164067 RepID=UPI001ABC3A74|nr:hypothetical protein [Algihabitans albus]